MTSFGNGVEDTSGPVATGERYSVPAPVERDILLLQGEEHRKRGEGDGTRERGRSYAKRERVVSKATSNEGRKNVLAVLGPPTKVSFLNVGVEQQSDRDCRPDVHQIIRRPNKTPR